MLAEKIAAFEGRIKQEDIDKEGFANLFLKFERIVSETNRQEKLSAASNILANVLLGKDDPHKRPYDELDHLMHCVDRLSSGAIATLGAVRLVSIRAVPAQMFSFTSIKSKLPQIEDGLILGFLKELNSLNLVQVSEGQITTSDSSHISIKITTIGLRFAERFVEGAQ